MKILITGANGFLGHYLVRDLLAAGHYVIATGKGDCRLPFSSPLFGYEEMDFTDPYSVHDVFEKTKPQVVVHAGAMSKPDACELDQWQAYVTNVEATLTLLANAEEAKAFFIFLSTDFVFDGEKGMYSEKDTRNAVNFYGRTKMDAEDAVMEYPFDWSIARTVFVYGKNRSGRENFLSLIAGKISAGEDCPVVEDQFRTPTYVEDLSAAIASIIEKKATGIFHLSGAEMLTPYQMACKVADYLHLDRSLIGKVNAHSFKEPARRPLRTGFNIEKAKKELGFQPVSFDEGLQRTFE
jgi:dTDP-4-dehydrorhamnose reductase